MPFAGRFDEPIERCGTVRSRQLVDDECRQNRRGLRGQPEGGHVASMCRAAHAKRAVGPGRFRDRPRVDVGAAHVGAPVPGPRPRRRRPYRIQGRSTARWFGRVGSGWACRAGLLRERPGDLAHREEMKGRVVERESRPLAAAVEGLAGPELVPPLDVARRQRPQRAAQFRAGQVRKIPGFGSFQPVVEGISLNHEVPKCLSACAFAVRPPVQRRALQPRDRRDSSS